MQRRPALLLILPVALIQRDTIVTVNTAEMPLAEIATHFGWSRVKAKVKAFRARQRLKSLLHQHGYTLT